MRESEPVGSVGEDGIVVAVVVKSLMDSDEPVFKALWAEWVGGGEGGEPAGLVFEREGGEAAEDEA